MARPLWLHFDGGRQITIGDSVLTEDVNADLGLLFLKSDYTSKAMEVTSIHLEAKQIPQTFLFLRSAPIKSRSRRAGARMKDGHQ